MGIIDFIFKQSFKVTVLHTLPGRLRIHIPILKSISDMVNPTYETIEELLFTVPGVIKITPNYISGNILILYEESKLDTAQIIRCLNVIWKTLVTNKEHFFYLDDIKSEIITKRVIKYFKNENINLTTIIGEVRIPNEIWL